MGIKNMTASRMASECKEPSAQEKLKELQDKHEKIKESHAYKTLSEKHLPYSTKVKYSEAKQ
jgi:hypothetical protein